MRRALPPGMTPQQGVGAEDAEGQLHIPRGSGPYL
jgi:hypothetical protein